MRDKLMENEMDDKTIAVEALPDAATPAITLSEDTSLEKCMDASAVFVSSRRDTESARSETATRPKPIQRLRPLLLCGAGFALVVCLRPHMLEEYAMNLNGGPQPKLVFAFRTVYFTTPQASAHGSLLLSLWHTEIGAWIAVSTAVMLTAWRRVFRPGRSLILLALTVTCSLGLRTYDEVELRISDLPHMDVSPIGAGAYVAVSVRPPDPGLRKSIQALVSSVIVGGGGVKPRYEWSYKLIGADGVPTLVMGVWTLGILLSVLAGLGPRRQGSRSLLAPLGVVQAQSRKE